MSEERFRAWFFDSALIEKVFKCLKTFAIGNDCVQRCNVQGENKFGAATTGRNDRVTWAVRFVNFRQEVNARSSRGVDDEISGSVW